MPHRQTVWFTPLIFIILAATSLGAISVRAQEDEELIDSAAPVSRKAKPKKAKRPKAAKKRAVEDESSSETPKANPANEAARVMAFRTVGVAEFEATKSGGPGADYGTRFAEALRVELKRQGLINPIDIPRVYSMRPPRGRILQECQDAAAEGIFVGEISSKDVQASLVSSLGRRAMGIKIPFKSADEEPRALAQRFAEAVARQFPSRGYITAVEGEAALINIGSRQKLEVGERLQVFEFENTNEGLRSAKRQTGELEVIEILSPESARAKITSGAGDVKAYQKIQGSAVGAAPEKAAPEKTVARPEVHEPSGPSNWQLVLGAHSFTAGAEQETSASTSNAYQVHTTMFGYIGARTTRGFEAHLLFGASKVDPYPISVYEFRSGYEFWSKTSGSIRWNGVFGGRVAMYTTALPASGLTPARSSTIYSLMARPRGTYRISSSLDTYFGMEFYFPLYSNLSSSMFNYGAGPEIGARWQFARSWAIEGGAFLRYYRRAVDGSDSVFERDLQIYGNLVINL